MDLNREEWTKLVSGFCVCSKEEENVNSLIMLLQQKCTEIEKERDFQWSGMLATIIDRTRALQFHTWTSVNRPTDSLDMQCSMIDDEGQVNNNDQKEPILVSAIL